MPFASRRKDPLASKFTVRGDDPLVISVINCTSMPTGGVGVKVHVAGGISVAVTVNEGDSVGGDVKVLVGSENTKAGVLVGVSSAIGELILINVGVVVAKSERNGPKSNN